MSPGDQIISALIGEVGTLVGGIITAFIASFVSPLFEVIAGLFGL